VSVAEVIRSETEKTRNVPEEVKSGADQTFSIADRLKSVTEVTNSPAEKIVSVKRVRYSVRAVLLFGSAEGDPGKDIPYWLLLSAICYPLTASSGLRTPSAP
jgi:hypothetical protein